MKAKNKTVIMWVAFALCLLFAAALFTGFFIFNGWNSRGKTYEVTAEIGEGSTIYRPSAGSNYGYRYGPTMMYNESGKLEAWFSSPPEGGAYGVAWDVLTYRSSDDNGKTWSDEYVSVEPLAGSEEALSVCDPAVIRMGGYYYMFYTSTIEVNGRYNNVYSARSTAPDGEWQRWNGNGWGGDVVKPVIVYGSDSEHYGIGEPSVVVVDGKIYIYYTYKGVLGNGRTVNQTRLTIGDATENFPLTLSEYGVVVGDKDSDEDSLDVKYVPAYGVWVGVTTEKRMSYRSRIKLYYSPDGKNFRVADINDDSARKYSHNVGITGDGNGHIDINKPQFVCYAYSENGFVWGRWATEFQEIKLSFVKTFDDDHAHKRKFTTDPGFEDGKTPAVWALSTASDYRTAWEAIDGDANTFYSSVGHNVTGISEYHSGKWYREALAVATDGSAQGLVITPRRANGGAVYGFPKAFLLQYSNDGVIWNTISEYKDYTAESDAPITFSFGKKIKANYFRIWTTELGSDEFGTYILQIAEISALK